MEKTLNFKYIMYVKAVLVSQKFQIQNRILLKMHFDIFKVNGLAK